MRIVFWVGVTLVVPITAGWIWHSSGDWGTWLLTVAVLGIAAWTLDATVLRPPSILISKPDELGLSDLIFYLYEQDGVRVPCDYLLQLHALIGNIGGKQAVVTSIKLTGFKSPDGKTVKFPDMPEIIGGHTYSAWTSWKDEGRSLDRRIDRPPFILSPHDILVVRFRSRRGTDWGSGWPLERLKILHDALTEPPAFATIEVVYRWGKHKKCLKKDIPIEVLQHKEYVYQLCSLTSNFTDKPSFPVRNIPFD